MNSRKSEMVLADSVNASEKNTDLSALEFSKKDKIAGCFDLRVHRKPPVSHSSTEAGHQAAACRTLAGMLSGLFRSKSDSTLAAEREQTGPQREMAPSHCKDSVNPNKPRRRFMRIVRDENALPPEQCDDNPHTISRYSQSFLESYYASKRSDTDPSGPAASAPSLSCAITGAHTILKKSSGDRLATSLPPPALGSSPTLKHATFFDEVEVIEYDLKDKVKTGVHYTHYDHIHEDEYNYDEDLLNDAIKEESDAVDLSNPQMDLDPVGDQGPNDAVSNSIFCPVAPPTDGGAVYTQHLEPTTKHVRLADRIAACQSALSRPRRASVTSTDSSSSVTESTSSGEELRSDFAARLLHIDRRSASPRHKKSPTGKKQGVDEYANWTGGILSCM